MRLGACKTSLAFKAWARPPFFGRERRPSTLSASEASNWKTNSLDGQRFHRGEQCDVPWFGVALAFRRLAFSRSRFRILERCRLEIANPQIILHTNVHALIPPSLDIVDGHAGGGTCVSKSCILAMPTLSLGRVQAFDRNHASDSPHKCRHLHPTLARHR